MAPDQESPSFSPSPGGPAPEPGTGRYRAILASTPDGFLLVDLQGLIVEANEAFASLVGWPLADLVGLPLHRIEAIQSADAILTNIQRIRSHGGARFETRHRRRDGSLVPVEITVSFVHGEDLLVAFVRDITPQARLRDVMRTLLEATSALVGEAYFDGIAQELCCALHADHLLIGEKAGDQIRSLAVSHRGEPGPPLTYPLAGSPCETALGRGVLAIPSGVARQFPQDTLLKELAIEAYVGVPLLDAQDQPLGILVALWRTPLPDAEGASALIQLFSTRTSLEIIHRRARRDLEASETRLRALLRAIPDLILILDRDGQYCEIPAGDPAKLFRPKAELIGRRLSDVFDAERAAFFMGHLTWALDHQRVARLEYPLEIQGRICWFLGTISPLGRDQAVLVARDITALKEAELALVERELHYRTLVDSMAEGVLLMAPDGRVLATNPAAERLLEYPGLLGTRIQAFPGRILGADARPCPKEELPLALVTRTGEPLRDHTLGLELQDGSVRWFSLNAQPVRADGLQPIQAVVVTFHDTTARMQAEARYRLISEESHDVIWILDAATLRFTYVSPSVQRLRGLSPEEVMAEPLEAALLPDARRMVAGTLPRRMRALADGDESARVMVHEVDQPRKDGSVVPTEVVTTLLTDETGSTTHILGVTRDISERRAAEAERRRLEAEIQHAQRLESLGSLAGGVAHDMNNVLAAILGLGSAIQSRPGNDPGLAKSMGTIIHAAERGRDLVRGLMDFARKGLEEPRPVDVNALVRREVDLLARTTLQRVTLTLELQEDLPTVLGDANALASSLMNLCVNGLDAMPHGGTLLLRTRSLPGHQVELMVQDSGEGMSPDVQARAMEPFFTTKPVGKGTGLGLAIVYGTVKAHGGTVDIQSQSGEGTRIHLRFPALRATPPQAEAPAQPQKAMPRNLHILLIDDDALIRATVPAMLEALGHKADTASGGMEGLRRVKSGPRVDLVILDLNMPGMDGIETFGHLRLLDPDLPILIATGHRDERLDPLLAAPHRMALLMKPYTLAEIQAVMSHLVAPVWAAEERP